MNLNYDKYSLKIENKPVVIKSAAFHYFRNPGENVWKDRLSKLKACGYNTIDLYFSWAYHSPQPGIYNFEEIRDIRKLLNIILELDLNFIARPGPYINAETSAGGLPPWLFNVPGAVLRNRKRCDFIYSKEYMYYVKEWYSRIIPIINEYSNLIAFQIENEYATNNEEADYIQELFDFARESGIKVPIFHNDSFCGGLYSDIVDIYAFDIYPAISFDNDWQENPYSFGSLDCAEENLRHYSPDAPLYLAELQSGWFDRWGGKGYEFIREKLGKEHINIVTKTALSQGITMFNHFLACGGTSWDNLASTEVYTSYDFAAPIAECGIPQENYYKAKEINYFLDAFNLAQSELLEDETSILKEPDLGNIFAKIRKDNINNCKWLFIRNLNLSRKLISLKSGYSVSLKPFDMKILPMDLDLFACKIKFSSMSIFARIYNSDHEIIFLIPDENSEMIISDYASISASDAVSIQANEHFIKILFRSIPHNDLLSCKFTKGDKTTEFIFIKEETADKSWIINNQLVIGPEYITDNNKKAAFERNSELEVITLDNCSIIKKKNIEIESGIQQKTNLNFKSYNCSPEIDLNFDYSNWNSLSAPSLFDCISNKVYSEFIWYKASYKGIIEQIEINALHCWSIYLNGIQAYAHDSFHFECGSEVQEKITVNLDKKRQEKNSMNELTILAQNMGFDKGFQNEPNLPRGILSLKTEPSKEIEWKISGGLTPQKENWYLEDDGLKSLSQNSYLKWLTANFSIELSENKFSPLYLEFDNPPFDKALIYLNDALIGHYWKSKGPQTKFYLMEGFLNSTNSISLLTWNNVSVEQMQDFNIKDINVNIKIGKYDSYDLICLDSVF